MSRIAASWIKSSTRKILPNDSSVQIDFCKMAWQHCGNHFNRVGSALYHQIRISWNTYAIIRLYEILNHVKQCISLWLHLYIRWIVIKFKTHLHLLCSRFLSKIRQNSWAKHQFHIIQYTCRNKKKQEPSVHDLSFILAVYFTENARKFSQSNPLRQNLIAFLSAMSFTLY